MRKLNKVKQLGRTHAHRKAMLQNMITSLLKHERIVSTKAKIKVLQVYSEKMITRAKKISQAPQPEAALHHKREILKKIKDRDIAAKLFDDIAVRYQQRNGGYTRIINLPARKSDSSKMAMIELTEYREPVKREKSSDKNQDSPKK